MLQHIRYVNNFVHAIYVHIRYVNEIISYMLYMYISYLRVYIYDMYMMLYVCI